MHTNDFIQQDNAFAPEAPEPFSAEGKDFAFLASVGKGLGEHFSLGLALSLYGKSSYNIAATDGNTRHYESLERFSPLLFFHW